MHADGHITTPSEIHDGNVTRYNNLTMMLTKNFQAMREAAATLPAEQKELFARKIEVAEVTHVALMNEFGRKP